MVPALLQISSLQLHFFPFRWDDVKRNNISLRAGDVIMSYIEAVRQQNIAYQRYCDIDVVVLSHLHFDHAGGASALMARQARISE